MENRLEGYLPAFHFAVVRFHQHRATCKLWRMRGSLAATDEQFSNQSFTQTCLFQEVQAMYFWSFEHVAPVSRVKRTSGSLPPHRFLLPSAVQFSYCFLIFIPAL
jgi:hypothetical protein